MNKSTTQKILLVTLFAILIIIETSFSFVGFETAISVVLVLLLVLSANTTDYSYTTAFLVGILYDLISSTPVFGYFSVAFLLTVGILKLLKNSVPVELLMFTLYLINVSVYLILFANSNIIRVLISSAIYLLIRIFIFLALKK